MERNPGKIHSAFHTRANTRQPEPGHAPAGAVRFAFSLGQIQYVRLQHRSGGGAQRRRPGLRNRRRPAAQGRRNPLDRRPRMEKHARRACPFRSRIQRREPQLHDGHVYGLFPPGYGRRGAGARRPAADGTDCDAQCHGLEPLHHGAHARHRQHTHGCRRHRLHDGG